MSDQPPLTPPSPPSPPSPGFEPYQAPAYGDVAPDAPTLHTPQAPATPPPSYGAAYPPTPSPYQVAPQYLRPVAGAPTHPLATTSLVLGIVGLVALALTPFLFVTFVGVLCSPFAIWLGVRARREIRRNPRAFSGEGMATGGFVTGIVGVVLGVLALVAVAAFVALFIWILGTAGP